MRQIQKLPRYLLSTTLLLAPVITKVAAAQDSPTFYEDISPIFQENCQLCHQPGSIAPFSLIDYEDARPWALPIREKVVERIMPPWHLNPYLGIQKFKNDRSLSDAEIETIVAWVDAGAPEGNPAEAPLPVSFPSGENYLLLGELGPPDLVVKSEPFTVPAEGPDKWWRIKVPTGLANNRWVRALEVLPAFPEGRTVTHHALVNVDQEHGDGGMLIEWSHGEVGDLYPVGTGKLLEAGGYLDMEIHYYPSGEEVKDDQVSVGTWLYPDGYDPEFETISQLYWIAEPNSLQIPPNSTPMFSAEHVLKTPIRLQSFQPHIHRRGKGMSMEAIYPDGRTELLSQVDDFQSNWFNNYIYADEAAPLLPAGTVLKFHVWFDNTEKNLNNPNPNDFVTWGNRAVDEMGHAWAGINVLTQPQCEQLVADREQQISDRN